MFERLPYPVKTVTVDGEVYEEYIIPDEDRAAVFEQLYPYVEKPAMDDFQLDIHVEKNFQVKDFKVIRGGGFDELVSPYFYEGGGTVIDWFDPDFSQN